jgi:predicted ferric reductase
MSTQLWWFTARASGITAWVLVTGSVLWGLALSTKALGRRPRASWLLDLHRFLGACAVVFTSIHVLAIVADSFVHFGLVDVLVPLASAWHPVAVASGIVAVYLLLAVEVTSLLRSRLSKRMWHATHLLSFPLFALATIHGVAAGTDARNTLIRAVALLGTAAVGVLTIVRTSQATAPPPAPAARPLPVPARSTR